MTHARSARNGVLVANPEASVTKRLLSAMFFVSSSSATASDASSPGAAVVAVVSFVGERAPRGVA